ncbi:MerC domain-containing protein [Motilimonas cestriensis]|uniref:MerC domain-containing protein n=1 Tax=Motilimonas cestriensis TaxID=2742685 RepID=A0ABS8WEI4_9GAMM|nr:MerC domain-containing protein [Motilimonas cestriensis]MCE2595969.1 MerC domain-containing protein [Motilimonas cestriensis]
MSSRKPWQDKLGVMFSGLCLGHCLLTPALLVLVGYDVFGPALRSEWPHRIFLLFALSLALLSLPKAWQQTRRPMIAVLGVLGAANLISGLFVHGPLELGFTLVGSVCLILAHVLSMHTIPAQQEPAAVVRS